MPSGTLTNAWEWSTMAISVTRTQYNSWCSFFKTYVGTQVLKEFRGL